PLMRDLVSALIDPVADDGRCDFMDAVAEHYPIQVMCHLLGVPAGDHEQFTAWNRAITWTLSLELMAHRAEAEEGVEQMDEYIGELIAARRAEPRDDLVTELVEAEAGGDRLSDNELHSLILALLFAGYDTTRNQLGLAMATFAEHPDQWAVLAEQPERA